MTTKYYRHKYGGVYQYLDIVSNKSDMDKPMILYQHIYPFEKKTYVRDKLEFEKYNKKISTEELDELLSRSKEEFQKEIMENKNKNRNQEEKQKKNCNSLDICDYGYII